mmetsp:Transcript_34307/g.86768  ORF Transcript_34307/g.86768 Transcript_34307/m.86768 type:complete len:345 (-) Transcript_34307:978-2012(-)
MSCRLPVRSPAAWPSATERKKPYTAGATWPSAASWSPRAARCCMTATLNSAHWCHALAQLGAVRVDVHRWPRICSVAAALSSRSFMAHCHTPRRRNARPVREARGRSLHLAPPTLLPDTPWVVPMVPLATAPPALVWLLAAAAAAAPVVDSAGDDAAEVAAVAGLMGGAALSALAPSTNPGGSAGGGLAGAGPPCGPAAPSSSTSTGSSLTMSFSLRKASLRSVCIQQCLRNASMTLGAPLPAPYPGLPAPTSSGLYLSSCTSMRCAWRTRPLLRHRLANLSQPSTSSCMGTTSCRMLNSDCHTSTCRCTPLSRSRQRCLMKCRRASAVARSVPGRDASASAAL